MKEWTRRLWFLVTNGQRGGEILIERERKAATLGAEVDPVVRAFMDALPGTVPGEIKTLAIGVELPVIPDEVGEED